MCVTVTVKLMNRSNPASSPVNCPTKAREETRSTVAQTSWRKSQNSSAVPVYAKGSQ